MLNCKTDEFGLAPQAELAHNLGAVDFHSARADDEALGNLCIAAAACRQAHNLAFAIRKRLEQIEVLVFSFLDVFFDQFLGQWRAQKTLSPHCQPDRIDQFRCFRAFEHVSRRPCI